MQLTTKGLKARDQSVSLQGCMLLVGANGSGKTSRADALRFLALGFVPALGRRPQDTAALMSGREMSVSLTLPDGRSISRWITRKDKGYVQGAEASWIKHGQPSEIGEEIKRLFGAEDVDAAEALDIRELLSATPNQRAARLEALAAAGRKTAAEIAEAVARFTVQRLADIADDRMPADYMVALEMVPERQAQVLKANAQMLFGKIRDGGLAGAISWANDEKRRAQADAVGKEKAAKELQTRAAEIPEPAAEELRALEQRRQDLDRRLGAIRQEASGYHARLARRKAAVDAVAAAQENRERWDAYFQGEHAAKCRRVQELKDQLAAHEKAEPKAPILPADGQIEVLRAKAAALWTKANGMSLPEPVSTAQEEAAVAELECSLIDAENNPWSEVLEIAQEIEDKLGAKFRTCEKQLKRLCELALAYAKDPRQVKAALEVAREKLQTRKELQVKALKHATEVQATLTKLREEAIALNEEADQRARKLQEDARAASAAYEAALGPWRAQARALRAEIDRLSTEISAASETAARAQERFLAAEKALEAAGPEEPPPATSTQEIEGQLAKVRQDLARLQQAQALHAEIKRALAAIEDAQAAHKVFAAIEWGAQKQREVEISEAGGPLLQVMSEFLQAAGRTEKPFVRAGGGSCAIGWTRPDGAEIAVAALSGGEWCLFTAALTTAILILRNPAVKFLLVEAGEADEAVFQQLTAAISAFSDRLTLALVLTPRPPAAPPTGWDVITFAEEPAYARAG